jgi:hypothetical protein
MPMRLLHSSVKGRPWVRFGAGLFTCLILLSSWSPLVASAQGKTLLPKDSEIPGWHMIDKPYGYSPEDLWKYINGEAEFYVAYGFVSLMGANYGSRTYSIGVDIFDMGEKLNAFGVFQSRRGNEPSLLKMGAASFGAEGYLVFYKDRYYVEVLSFGEREKGDTGHVTVARKVAEKIKGDISPPHELFYLPHSGRIGGSERYVRGGILGHAFLDRGLIADYRIDGDTVSAFVAFFPSTKDAISSVEKHKGFLERSGATCIPLSGFGKQGYASQEPHHKEILVVQEGAFVVGVYDLIKSRQGMALLQDMVKRIQTAD